MDSNSKELVNIGTQICERLKQIYFSDKPWAASHARISKGFSLLKQKARIYYPEMSELEMLKQISKYCDREIKELMQVDLPVTPNTNKYGLKLDTATAIDLYSKLVG